MFSQPQIAIRHDRHTSGFMRNLFFILSSTWLCALPLCASTLTFRPSPATPLVGTNFQLNLILPALFTIDHADLYAYSVDIQFNPAVLQAISVTEGPFLATGGSTFFFEGSIDNSTGLISNIAASLLGAVRGASALPINLNGDLPAGGVLFSVVFRPIAATPTTVSLSNVQFQDTVDVNNFTADVLALNNISIANTIVLPANPPINDVPEPSTSLLLGTSLAVGWLATRRSAKQTA